MAKAKKPTGKALTVAGKEYSGFLSDVTALLDAGRQAAARAVNAVLTATYWEVGRRIVAFEQGGKERAGYGEAVIDRLAGDLGQSGKGFSRSNLFQMRAFFLGWEIVQTPSGLFHARAKLAAAVVPQTPGRALTEAVPIDPAAVTPGTFPLPWSHYVRLLSIETPAARRFYEEEAVRGAWSVRQLSDAVTMLSGFGVARGREWFAERYLSDGLLAGNRAAELYIPKGGGTDPWSGKNPVWKLKHETRWIDPASGATVTLPKWTEYIKVNYYTYKVGDSANKQHDYDKLIDRHPEVANGWTRETHRQMRELLAGTAIILGGKLRVLPLPAAAIPVSSTVAAMQHSLDLAEGHIRAGRIPVLQDSTKAMLLEKASEYERRKYGYVAQAGQKGREIAGQASLFD